MPNWIRVAPDVHDDPQVNLLATELSLHPCQMVGHLVSLWAKMAAHARDGNLKKIADPVIESWARWDGDRGAFAHLFRLHFTRKDRVKNWQRYNGKALRRAELDAERKRRYRQKMSRGRSAGHPPDSPQDDPRNGNVRDETRRDETRRTTNRKKNPLGADAPPKEPWLARCIDLWRQLAGEPQAGRLGKALKGPYEQVGREPLLAALESWLRAGKATFGPENFAQSYRSFLPNDELIQVYDERGEMTPAAATILRSPR